MLKRDAEEKREEIIEFIKKNPLATYKLIRKQTKLHPERIFKSIKEAYEKAGIPAPRTFTIKTKEEKRKIILDYIKSHPKVGGHTIRKETKINFQTIFPCIKDAYAKAGIPYPRKTDSRDRGQKKREIIELVKRNPSITITELTSKSKSKPYNFFKSMKEIYQEAGINKIEANEKRKLKKRQKVIEFIKNNPLATQREINQECKTHVRDLFKNSIFGAYESAGINFPYERLKMYGASQKLIKQRSAKFEEDIARKLSGYGKVNRLVKTKRGFADIILERKNKKAIIEVKDYEAKEISISQVKQLNKYLEDCNCNLGFLVCFKKPKKDTFLIGENKIFILEASDIFKIPEIMGP